MTDKTRTSRRDLLIALAALGAAGGGWQLWANRPQRLRFTPIEGLPGWREASTTGITAPRAGLSAAALTGLDSRETPTPVPAADLCNALYGPVPAGRVPVAIFSDFFCPFCRTLVPRIAAQAQSRPESIAVTWHELPLLGPASEIAARAAIAADIQNGYAPFQDRMATGAFRPTPQFLFDTAVDAGLDPGRLVVDMEGPHVASRIAQSRAVAAALGIYGTPAITVGRSLVIGEITDRQFADLVEEEAGRTDGC